VERLSPFSTLVGSKRVSSSLRFIFDDASLRIAGFFLMSEDSVFLLFNRFGSLFFCGVPDNVNLFSFFFESSLFFSMQSQRAHTFFPL